MSSENNLDQELINPEEIEKEKENPSWDLSLDLPPVVNGAISLLLSLFIITGRLLENLFLFVLTLDEREGGEMYSRKHISTDDFIDRNIPHRYPISSWGVSCETPSNVHDSEIERLKGITERHKSDNDAKNMMNQQLANSPVVLKKMDQDPGLEEVTLTSETVEVQQGLFGPRITKRKIHQSTLKF